MPGPRPKDPIVRFAAGYTIADHGYATPCWDWHYAKTYNGYGKFAVGGQRSKTAHRWRWEHDHGPVPEGMHLDHLCSNRGCVNPDHLEVVDPLTNARRSRSAKLTTEQAEEIYRRKQNGERTADVASLFGVSKSLVNLIAKNGHEGPRNPAQNAHHRATLYPSKIGPR